MSTPVQLPFEHDTPLQIAPLLRKLQTQGTVHEVRTAVGDKAWLVTSYDRVRQLLGDKRLGRSHPDPDRASRTGESVLFGGPLGNFDTEWTDSARMRSLLQPHFSPKRMRDLRSRVEILTTRLLDDLAAQGSPADLHAALALPLPILVICELLGVPYEDRNAFRAWTQDAGNVCDRARSQQGMADLFGYARQLVTRKRHTPGDDVISRLCEVDGVPDDEIAMLTLALLFAGHETTVVQIGLGALLLLTNPDQWQAMLDDPTIAANAVEEILRAPGHVNGGIPRYARVDLEIDGFAIRTGDLVLLDIAAGNHDEAVYPDADRFDIGRQATPHLTFGHGMRYCIGAPLARIELQAVFSQLAPRFPTMRLAVPLDELTLRQDTLTGGLIELPVTW
jgi:cytochrome P450